MRTIIGRFVVLTVALGVLFGSAAVGEARPKKPSQTINCRCTCVACTAGKCYNGSTTDFQTTSTGSGSGACEMMGMRVGCTVDTPAGDLRGTYSGDCKLTGTSSRAPQSGNLPPLTPTQPPTLVPKAPIGPAPIDPAR
jgi:hypothetical protein